MSEADAGFLALRQATAPDAAAVVEELVRSGEDHELGRINPLHLARRTGLREDDQIVPIGASAMMSSKIVKQATLKIYEGAPHGLAQTHQDRLNADLLAFIRG